MRGERLPVRTGSVGNVLLICACIARWVAWRECGPEELAAVALVADLGLDAIVKVLIVITVAKEMADLPCPR